MAYTEKRLVPGSALTAAAAVYYTVPETASKAIVKEMTLCNTDEAAARTFTLYIVPASGSPGAANAEFYKVSLQPKETRIFARTCVMETGGTIQALADAPSVVALSVSGVERSV